MNISWLGYESGELARIQIASGEVVFLEARHDQAIQILQASWDGSRVLGCGQDGSISLTLVDTGEKIGEMAIQSEPIACSFSADEKQAIIIGKETGLWFFSLLDGALMEHIPSDEPISAAAFSPDLQWLALASKSTVGIWNLPTRTKGSGDTPITSLHRSLRFFTRWLFPGGG